MSIEAPGGTAASDAAARPAPAPRTARAAVAGWWSREVDARRPFLWLPVAMAAGIALYFAADGEPAPGLPLALAAAAGLAAWHVRRALLPRAACLAAAMACLGFGLSAVRTAGVAAPVIDRPVAGVLGGFVESAEARVAGGRIVVRVHDLAGHRAERRPWRVRVTLPDVAGIKAGDFIVARVRLVPPPPASRPGGYDFAREAFFQRLGGVGSVIGPVAIAPPPVEPPLDLRVGAAVDRARNALTRRIVDVIGGPAGPVAASLVTGKRGLIPEPVNETLRAAGIYHVVSISGLHMVLAAGMVFWGVRALGAAVPAVALRWPVRKIAAAAAILAGAAYNVFAGAEIATQRALIMTVALFGAVLVDRAALSMRNLAIAALVVMALEPESLLGPSFQMSFAAVAALIALYERTGAPVAGAEAGAAPQPAPPRPPEGWIARGLRLLAGTAAATLAAEAATAAFSLYHFQRLTLYGLVGNALTLPLVSFVVMPMAVLGALASPFGLDAPFWQVMGLGVDAMLAVSAHVAAWPGAVAVVPAFGPLPLLLTVAAGLWLVLMTTPLRWAALAPAAAGIGLAAAAPAPALVVSADGRSAAVRQADGRLALAGASPGAFALDQWLRADGDPRTADDASLRGARCDPAGCVARLPDGRAVAVVARAAAFAQDCRRAHVVVTPLVAPVWCRPAALVDRAVLARTGALVLYPDGEGFAVRPARSLGARRPWHPAAPPPAPAPTGRSAAEEDEPDD